MPPPLGRPAFHAPHQWQNAAPPGDAMTPERPKLLLAAVRCARDSQGPQGKPTLGKPLVRQTVTHVPGELLRGAGENRQWE